MNNNLDHARRKEIADLDRTAFKRIMLAAFSYIGGVLAFRAMPVGQEESDWAFTWIGALIPFGLFALPLYHVVWAIFSRITSCLSESIVLVATCAIIGLLPALASFTIWGGPFSSFLDSELGQAYLVQFAISGIIFGTGAALRTNNRNKSRNKKT